jgi:hypothetical protein
VKRSGVIGALVGLVGLGWLVWRTAPAASVAAALGALGGGGFTGLIGLQLVTAAVMSSGWSMLAAGAPVSAAGFYAARLARESVSQILPFTQIGGVAFGGRALVLLGAPAAVALAATVIDTAMEFFSEVAYVGLGAGFLALERPGSALAASALALTGVLCAMAAGLLLVQTQGPNLARRLLRRRRVEPEPLGPPPAGKTPDGVAEARSPAKASALGGLSVAQAFETIGRRRRAGALNIGLHALAWGLSGFQTWWTLALLRAPVSGPQALIIDSVAAGARAAAFLVPGGLGVQEGAMVLLGGLFGVPPAGALALSLIRRARDLVIAAPVLAGWQLRYGAAIWIWRPAGSAASIPGAASAVTQLK